MLDGVKIGWVLTGSHCTMSRILPQIEGLIAAGASVTPILSPSVATVDSRFGTAADLRTRLVVLTGREPLTAFTEVEPIGPKRMFDVLVVAPCTGNTAAKLANGISDTPAAMAIKSHLRNGRPVVLSVSTNDGLAANGRSLGQLLNTKNIFFVPLGQDNPLEKPTSLDAKVELLPVTIEQALLGRQVQPVLIERWH